MSRNQRTVAVGSTSRRPSHDMDIVSLARPQHRSVRAESDRLIVVILRPVNDPDALHAAAL